MADSLKRRKPNAAGEDEDALKDWRHTALDARPGFLIRRLHQIHVALFVEECAPEGITPVQYSILTALEQLGPAEQIALSRAVGLDRANTADVIGRLVERRFIQRRVSKTDKRKKVAELTDIGRALLGRLEKGVARAHERTLRLRRKIASASWRTSRCSSKLITISVERLLAAQPGRTTTTPDFRVGRSHRAVNAASRVTPGVPHERLARPPARLHRRRVHR
jgi:DNA-binding MarR family transcriptional regulator